MKKIGYILTYYPVIFWMHLHALLPFRLLYVLSDILYVIVYRIVGYRLKVVRTNMKNSFPDKSEKELKDLEKEFYSHFCDYFVETIKLLHFSDKEAKKRITFKNVELVKELMKDDNSCMMFLGHYGNWEWVPAITRHFTEEKDCLGQIYRKLNNKAFDDIFLKLRSRFGSLGIEKGNTLREILQIKRSGKRMLIGFMADQGPSPVNIHYWTNFLNQDTPVYTGVERIAKKTGFSVVYLDVQKVGRGYYSCELKLISEKPQDDTEEFSITERYIREMENTILRNPAYWLWTHRRWKHKRENFEK